MNAPYLFGPLERRGIFLGARLGQLVVGVVATILTVAILGLWPSALGAVAALLVIVSALAATTIPIAGRTAEEWAPVVVHFLADGLTCGHRWLGTAHLRGHRIVIAEDSTAREVHNPRPPNQLRASRSTDRHHRIPAWTSDSGDGGDARVVSAVRRADAGETPPPYLRDVELLAARWRQGEVGVIKDARHHTYVGVVAARGRRFTLCEAGEKERLLAQWGAVLDGLARERSAVTRIQWLERTSHDDSETVVRHLQSSGVLAPSSAFVSSYLALLDEAGPRTQQHEVFLALQVSAVRASATIRRLRSGVDVGACDVLSHELCRLAQALRQAEVEVCGVLSPRMLTAAIRHAVDPQSRGQLAHRTATHPHIAGASPHNALPRRSVASWSSFCTEGAHHATYWVSEWPRTPVGTDWMSPLLLSTHSPRAVSVVMEPSAPTLALRRVEAARVDDETTQSLRDRFGFRRTVRRRREQENVKRAEEELNAGHHHFALSAYITVSAGTPRKLDAACADVEQQARQSGFDVRREYGTQDVAFTYTLPLCRGLR